MTAEPLMLSDTAMLLLRQYEELTQQYRAIRDTLDPYSLNASKEIRVAWDKWRWQQNYVREIEQIEESLLREISLLWRNSDLQPIRHLDWHLVLDCQFITWAEQARILTWFHDGRRYQDAWTEIGGALAQFFGRLSRIYREVVAVRSTASLLSKEMSR